MPTVSVDREVLFEKIGQTFSNDEFDRLCFEFGIELDEIVEAGDEGNGLIGVQYKIDVPANRYDLLCVEGIATALAVFINRREVPKYRVVKPQNQTVTTYVSDTVSGVRPFIVTAVVRGVRLTSEVYRSLIDLQEKLHHNVCRKRAFVAIGLHDLDTLHPPFAYSARAPGTIHFQPLGQSETFAADKLLEYYATSANEMHLRPYLHLVQDRPMYPVLKDSNDVVLSLPPIINGNHSRLIPSHDVLKNLFIECTATDMTKANIVLDTMVTMLSEYAQNPYEVEETKVVYANSNEEKYPKLAYRLNNVNVELANQTVGIELSAHEMAQSLSRMGLKSKVLDEIDDNGSSGMKSSDKISVEIPPTRHDILHQCDIMEDIAISYGYLNIKAGLPPTSTVAAQIPMNKLGTQLRHAIAEMGFTETLTFSLCSMDDECRKLRQERTTKEPKLVLVSNPKSHDFQVVRSTLLPGLLKTIQANQNIGLPLKLFEVSDVVECCSEEESDTGARNRRHLCAVYYGKTAGLEVIHGVLDRCMLLLEVEYPKEYWLQSAQDAMYFPGRSAQVMHKNKMIGWLGVLHPEVIEEFGLHLPCSVLEICIDAFV